MVHDSEQTETSETTSQFEKNRFFEGKLMTARDMRTEQQYHAERLELLARHATGSGIVQGLTVRSIEPSDDGLEISVGPGVAIDGAGRPIVIETPTTKSVPAPEGNELYLFVRFDEVALESVPVPDADTTETAPNRLVEVFELTYRERPPDRASVPGIDLDAAADSNDPEVVADRLAAAYHDRHRTDGAAAGEQAADEARDTSVYLGGFERTADGTWTRSETAPRPEYVCDQDLLYATLVEHLTDTDNPHDTEVEAEPPTPDLDPAELEGIHERVDYLQSELADLEQRQRTTATHLRGKSFETTARLFRSVADAFADHDGGVSKTAHEIAHQVADVSQTGVETDPEQYCSAVRELHASLVAFGDKLGGAVRETTTEQYLDAVADLTSALEDEAPAVEVAIALDRVAEAAADLEPRYPAAAER